MKLRVKRILNKQNELTVKILKYNKFWCKFYMIMLINFLPINIILFQQVLFGRISLLLRILFINCLLFGVIFIVLTSLIVCFLEKQLKNYRNILIKLQFNSKLNVNTKLKVINHQTPDLTFNFKFDIKFDINI